MYVRHLSDANKGYLFAYLKFGSQNWRLNNVDTTRQLAFANNMRRIQEVMLSGPRVKLAMHRLQESY